MITLYCRKCGTKLGNSAKFCTFCGEPTGEPPVRHVPVPQQEKSSFQTWKLVSGIITIVFCTFIFTLAGCASILSDYAGTHYSVMDSKAACSALSIACGIVSIATRARPDIKGDVAIIVLGIMVCVISVEGHDPIQAVWMIACSIVAAACIHSKSTMYWSVCQGAYASILGLGQAAGNPRGTASWCSPPPQCFIDVIVTWL